MAELDLINRDPDRGKNTEINRTHRFGCDRRYLANNVDEVRHIVDYIKVLDTNECFEHMSGVLQGAEARILGSDLEKPNIYFQNFD